MCLHSLCCLSSLVFFFSILLLLLGQIGKKGTGRSLCKALLVLSSSLVFCSFPKDFDVCNRLTKDNSCAIEYCGENECISLGKQGVGTFLLHYQQLSLCCLGLCHAAGLNMILLGGVQLNLNVLLSRWALSQLPCLQ